VLIHIGGSGRGSAAVTRSLTVISACGAGWGASSSGPGTCSGRFTGSGPPQTYPRRGIERSFRGRLEGGGGWAWLLSGLPECIQRLLVGIVPAHFADAALHYPD
jgi:hypothetical protein